MIQHQVVEYLLLPDEREPLEKELKRLADQRQVHVRKMLEQEINF